MKRFLFTVAAVIALALTGCAVGGLTKPYVEKIETPTNMSIDLAYVAAARALGTVGTVTNEARASNTINGINLNSIPTNIRVERGAITVTTQLPGGAYYFESKVEEFHNNVVKAIKEQVAKK